MAAPSLVSSIKLRSLVDQLNNVEFTQFLSELVHLCGRNIILTPLFHQLTASSQTALAQIQPDIIENIVEITRNIIRSRKDEPQKTISTATFNSLSGNLIGELASYLEHTDYICFSKVNRAAMIHCNTPNTLRCLDIFHGKSLQKYLQQNESFDLQRYPSINRLYFPLKQFDKLRLLENTVANNLQHLHLFCRDADVNNIQGFMNQNFINLNNIKSLSLYFIRSGNINATLWRKILLKFRMVQHLSLLCVSENIFSNIDIQTLFVNLKGVRCDPNLTNKFLRVYGNKLEYLFLSQTYNSLGIDSNISFTKLQQLQLGLVGADAINAILKTAKQLRKVSVRSNDKNIIEKIMSSQPLLEYIHIEYPLECESVFAGIESGLYNTKKMNRKRFKISINLYPVTLEQLQSGSNLILHISRITNILSQFSNVNEFMFILRFRAPKKKVKEIMKAVDDFRECQKTTIYVVKTYCDDTNCSNSIVITNKNCKINGFSESWMFDVAI